MLCPPLAHNRQQEGKEVFLSPEGKGQEGVEGEDEEGWVLAGREEAMRRFIFLSSLIFESNLLQVSV